MSTLPPAVGGMMIVWPARSAVCMKSARVCFLVALRHNSSSSDSCSSVTAGKSSIVMLAMVYTARMKLPFSSTMKLPAPSINRSGMTPPLVGVEPPRLALVAAVASGRLSVHE